MLVRGSKEGKIGGSAAAIFSVSRRPAVHEAYPTVDCSMEASHSFRKVSYHPRTKPMEGLYPSVGFLWLETR